LECTSAYAMDMVLTQFSLRSLLLASLSLISTCSALAAESASESVPEALATGVTKTRPKIGLALGGGGMRSAACVGVLKVLDEEGIPVDVLVGSGMGAVVGGLYCAGLTPQHIAEQFTDKKLMSAYVTVPLKLRVLVIPLFYTPRIFGIEPYDGLYRGKKFASYLNKQVPETERNIEDLKMTFGAVAVNLIDGRTVTMTRGNLGKALQASAAIPALRKPVKLAAFDNGLFVDGGVLVNIPVTEARKLGADIVIAVNVDESLGAVTDKDFHKVGSVSHRVVTLHFREVDAAQLAKSDYVIRPNVDGIGMISTRGDDAKQCIQSGETAARRAIPAIRELIELYNR